MLPCNMQNEPNLRNAQMNITYLSARNYGDIRHAGCLKNEPNTNPNEPNLRNDQNEHNLSINKVLWKYATLRAQAKQSQFGVPASKSVIFVFFSRLERDFPHFWAIEH